MRKSPGDRANWLKNGEEPSWLKIWKLGILSFKSTLPRLLGIFLPASFIVVGLNREANLTINLSIQESFEKGRIPLLSLLGFGADALKATLLSVSSGIVMIIIFATGVVIATDSIRKESKTETFAGQVSGVILRLPRLIGVTAIWGVATFGGLFLLVVPGILLSLKLSMVIPVVLIEGKKIKEAISRSNKISKGRLRKLFVILFPYFVIFFLLTSWVSSLTSSFLPIIGSLSSSLAVALTTALGCSLISSSYLALLAREGKK